MMDFMTGLSKLSNSNDAIWIIVDRLSKIAHFLAFRVGHTLKKLNFILKKL